MPPRTAVLIHPDFDPLYYGFYVEGLRRLFGRGSVRVGMRAFPGAAARSTGGKLTMRMVVEKDGATHRIAVEADDMLRYDPMTVEWAEHVGKVNYAASQVPAALAGRVIALGPSFAIAAWRGVDVARWAAGALVAPLPLARRRQLAGNYLRQALLRVPIDAYRPRASEADYLFFAAKGWLRNAEVNPPRAIFMRVARSRPGLRFEGGFVPTSEGSPPELAPLMAPRPYKMAEYLERTARSVVAFNTPAVHDCLGWKLGEFLALGKAIVSVPLKRELPEPLVHGKDIHFVDGDEDSMAAALDLLRRDHSYRQHLERNARAYYDKLLAPEVVTRRLLVAAGVA